MSAISFRAVSKSYRGGFQRKTALQRLDLEVQSGEVFGFLGPNGAGKSTAIKSIMGLIQPTSGVVLTKGIPCVQPESRRYIGYLPENPAFYEFLTGREYLTFVGRAFRMEEGRIFEGIGNALTLLDLADAADRPIRGYSKGMVQRLGLAQTVVHDPDIFVLDEPMSGLDPIGRALVKDIIRELKGRGKTVFFSTHITSDVEAVCDRVGVIVKGRLQVVESVARILQSGVEGYSIQVSGVAGSLGMTDRYGLAKGRQDIYEGYVPKERFNDFMQEVIAVGATLEWIETRRKDLESFFLEVTVRRGGQ